MPTTNITSPTGALQARVATLERRVAELARTERASRALEQIGRELAGTLDLDRATQRIVEIVVEFFQTPCANLYQLDESRRLLTCVASAGLRPDNGWVGRRYTTEEGSSGQAVREGRLVYWPDFLALARADRKDEILSAAGRPRGLRPGADGLPDAGAGRVHCQPLGLSPPPASGTRPPTHLPSRVPKGEHPWRRRGARGC